MQLRLLKIAGKRLCGLSQCLIDALSIVFIVLSLFCASLLIQGNFKFEGNVALGAYFILGSGVVLQITSFVRRANINGLEGGE